MYLFTNPRHDLIDHEPLLSYISRAR